MTTTARVRHARTTTVVTGMLTAAAIGAGLVTAPSASADPSDMAKCFIAHGIVERAAITVGDWQVGTPLVDPPGGIDRDSWFRTYAICSVIVKRQPLR